MFYYRSYLLYLKLTCIKLTCHQNKISLYDDDGMVRDVSIFIVLSPIHCFKMTLNYHPVPQVLLQTAVFISPIYPIYYRIM